MEPRFNYLGLLIVIIVGVTAGNLISTWITAKIVETKVEKTTAEISKTIAKKTKNAKQKSKNLVEPTLAPDAISQEELMKQRKYDVNGSRLAKNCNEWREADKEMNTQTTKRESAKHCDIYEKYVNNGELPQRN